MPVMANEPIILNVYDMVRRDLLLCFINVAFNVVRAVDCAVKTKDPTEINLFFCARMKVLSNAS